MNPHTLDVLTGVNRGAGVVAALLGVVVSAPDGFRLLARQVREATEKALWRVRVVLVRVPGLTHLFPGLDPRRDAVIHAGTAEGKVEFGTPTVWGMSWPSPDASNEEWFMAIGQRFDRIEARFAELKLDNRQEHVELRRAIETLRRDLSGQVQELTSQIERTEHADAIVNFHGLWVLGCGVVLAATPDVLASRYGLEMIAMLLAVIAAWQTFAAIRKHWRSKL